MTVVIISHMSLLTWSYYLTIISYERFCIWSNDESEIGVCLLSLPKVVPSST